MMAAASFSLLVEGMSYLDEPISSPSNSYFSSFNTYSIQRTIAGIVSGIVFILLTKKFLDNFEDVKFDGIDRASAQKMILIIFVMTLHSMTEGIGIGVSFGGQRGMYTFMHALRT